VYELAEPRSLPSATTGAASFTGRSASCRDVHPINPIWGGPDSSPVRRDVAGPTPPEEWQITPLVGQLRVHDGGSRNWASRLRFGRFEIFIARTIAMIAEAMVRRMVTRCEPQGRAYIATASGQGDTPESLP